MEWVEIRFRFFLAASSSQCSGRAASPFLNQSGVLSLTAVLMKFWNHPERGCAHSPPNVLETHTTEAEC